MQAFWEKQMRDMSAPQEFKDHQLPLARIKRLMRTDPDVKVLKKINKKKIDIKSDICLNFGRKNG